MIVISNIQYPMLVDNSSCTRSITGGYFAIHVEDLELIDEYESSAYRKK